MKILLTSLAIVLLTCRIEAAPKNEKVDAEGFVLDWDAHQSGDWFADKKFEAPHEIKRVPLFDNAPFLRLQAGDKLFAARRENGWRKGVLPRFAEHDSLFIERAGKFIEIAPSWEWSREKNNRKLELSDVSRSIWLDWNVTLPNAEQLIKIHRQNGEKTISLPTYRSLRAALKNEFASTLRDDTTLELRAPFLEVGAPKPKTRAVFERLVYDRFRNLVFEERVILGNGIYWVKRRDLIVGPPHVERWEFEGNADTHGTINGPPLYVPDAKTAATKRATFNRMEAFRRVVETVLSPDKTANSL